MASLHLGSISFILDDQMKNDVTQVFRALVRHREGRVLAVMEKHPVQVRKLAMQYSDTNSGLLVGVLLRECIASPLLTRVGNILYHSFSSPSFGNSNSNAMSINTASKD